MPRKTTAKKPKLGRPRRQPLDLELERQKAREGIRRTTQRQLGLDELDVEEFVYDASRITGKHKFNKLEIYKFRRMLDELYKEFVQEKHIAEWELNADFTDTLRAEALTKDLTDGQSMMSREDWYKEHGLRKDGKGRKPGPKPKKKKMVWQLEPGERGNGTEPAEPIDVEAIEQAFMDREAAALAEEKRSRPSNTVGKRLRKTAPEPLRRTAPKNFWV